MKKSISGIAMILLVFVAGCTESDVPTNSQSPGDSGGSSGSSNIGSDYLSMIIEDFPSTITKGEKLTFTFEVQANKVLEDVTVLMYDFGSYIESSCSGKSRLGDFEKYERMTRSCTIEVVGYPKTDTLQEMKYEINFKTKSEETTILLKIFDSIEFERSNPIPGSNSQNLGTFGEIHMEPKNAEEGRPVDFRLSLNDKALVENPLCNCHVEKITIEFPIGFVISGLSDWTKKSCGSNYCYSLLKVKAPFDKEFTAVISGVTRSNEFYIDTKFEGIWGYMLGSKSFKIVPENIVE